MSVQGTERLLEDETDEGKFEKLATAVLRKAVPTYRAITHPGVNADGRTVKSPVDCAGYVLGAEPPHLVIAHHTITSKDRLEGKWLHDPSTVKPRKGKPTAPPGDLLKAAGEVEEHRKLHPNLQVTLILTTNQEPDSKLVGKTTAAGKSAGMDVDIWSRSLIAQFLDGDPQGQWIRYQYYGKQPERLSHELLHHLSKKSIESFGFPDDANLWVDREIDDQLRLDRKRGVTFLIAASGLGKSAACLKLLNLHVKNGHHGMVLSHQIIETCPSLERAIETGLSELCPALAPGQGAEALAICSPENPFLIVVEDINASGAVASLAERIAGWDQRASNSGPPPFRIVCPMWPEVLGNLREKPRSAVLERAIFASAFVLDEGANAVRRRAEVKGLILSDLEAIAISDSLGNDPLLIALHDPSLRTPHNAVIGDFVASRIDFVAGAKGDHPSAKYHMALRAFMAAALSRRSLDPLWTEVESWQELHSEYRLLIGHLAAAGDVIRLTGTSVKQRIAFRHDRVRDWLLLDAAASLSEQGLLSDDILEDPFYAEIIGGVIAANAGDASLQERIAALNPLALFHGLRLAATGSIAYRQILDCATLWLRDNENLASLFHLKFEISKALATIESPDIMPLVGLLPKTGWYNWEVRLRNGDIGAALEVCMSTEPGTVYLWWDLRLAHLRQKLGDKLSKKVTELLCQGGISEELRVGLIRLAGHLEDTSLAPSLEVCWRHDPNPKEHLSDYLYAFAYCAGAAAAHYLKPVCDVWAQLPSQDGSQGKPSPRDDLAAHGIRWAFERKVPREAVSYLAARARDDDALRWPITYLMAGVDDPIAVDFTIREIARYASEREGGIFYHPITHHWRDIQRRDGVTMSATSRSVAETYWLDPVSDEHLRMASFKIWAATQMEEDLAILRLPNLPSDLERNILWERLIRSDRTAIDDLISKLRGEEKDASWWWHTAKFVWEDRLLPELDAALSRRAEVLEKNPESVSDSDDTIIDLMMRIPIENAVHLLDKYWLSVGRSNYYVHLAFYVATPEFIKLANEAMASSIKPDELAKHMWHHIGLNTADHPGVNRVEQVKALAECLAYFPKHTLSLLWELCNSKGWLCERDNLIAPALRKFHGIIYIDDDATFAALDEMSQRDRYSFLDHWLDEYKRVVPSIDSQMALFGRWFKDRGSRRAFLLLAEIISEIGRRQDLWMLNLPISDSTPDLEALRNNTVYAVRRRSIC